MKKVLFTLCILSLGIIGYTIFQLTGSNTKEIDARKDYSYALGIVKEDGSLEEYTINAKDRDQFKIKVTNDTPKRAKFIMNVYINYEKINFELVEKQKKISNHEIEIESGLNEILSIKIPKDKLIYKLNPMVIEVVSDPDTHAKDKNILEYTNGVRARYDLINDSETITSKPPEPKQINNNQLINLQKNGFQGILLNTDFTKIDQFNPPSLQIHSKPNEEVELAVRTGGLDQTKNYLVWLNLQHKQVSINNQKYLYYQAPLNHATFEKITFQAPSEKGDYEIYAYLVQNPWGSIALDGFTGTYIHPSERITLCVE